jgi:Zn-finger nucleic acid-binding protein
MHCPKCNSDMEDLEIYEVIIKRCTVCKGLFFDRSKHEYLKNLEDVEEIDTGNPEVGKAFNKKKDIHCPECASPMINMVVADQPHIWYESCSHCFSVFFDAGEFSDYVEKDIFDYFKGAFSKERK